MPVALGRRMSDRSRNPSLSLPPQRLAGLVGRTPLLEIAVERDGRRQRIFAKYESLNFSGSIKDRMALAILERGYAGGTLRPGDEIVEASSGNTAIAFAAMGRALGHPVTIFMPDWMSRERVEILGAFGVQRIGVSAEQGGFVGSVQMARDYARSRPHTFEPRQFSNRWNIEAHARGTAREIAAQLRSIGEHAEAVVAGVGTGGTIMGLREGLSASGDLRAHPLEPAESPILSQGRHCGHHRIQGISDEFIPDLVNLALLDSIVAVADGDAILMAQKLARELGLGVGISSGANFIGALALLDRYGDAAVVVTVFPDSHKKYLSTDLVHEEPVREGYLAPRVRLIGLRSIPYPPEPASADRSASQA